MSALVLPVHRPPPPIYRVARALRRFGAVVIVLLILYVGTVAYSAYEAAHATVESRSLEGVLVANGDLEVSGSFTLSNPGIYPIQHLELVAQLANDTGVHLGSAAVGPETVDAGQTGLFVMSASLPINGSAAVESLLFVDQYIEVSAWANVTYAYLFPISVGLSETRSWGAPFEGFHATVGAPALMNGMVVAPVTFAWDNHASFAEDGAVSFVVDSASRVACGSSSIPMNVAPGGAFDETEDVALSPTCSPAGGELLASVTVDGSTTPLPPEAIP